MQTFYASMTSDQLYQLSYVRSIADGKPLEDYFYSSLPTHYPPLTFWIAAAIARLPNSSAIVGLRVLPLLTISAVTVSLVRLARAYHTSPTILLLFVFGVGSFTTSYFAQYATPDRAFWAITLAKPQHMISTVAFVIFLFYLRSASPSWKLAAATALFVAVSILTMPLSIGFAIIGGIWLIREMRRDDPLHPLLTSLPNTVMLMLGGALLGILATAPYIWPLARAIVSANWENNYIRFQSGASFDLTRWTVGFGFCLPLMFAAIAALRYSDAITRALVATAIASLGFASTAYLTFPLWGISFLTWYAPMYFGLIFCILAARVVTEWFSKKNEFGEHSRLRRYGISPFGVVVLASVLLLPAGNWNSMTDLGVRQGLAAYDSLSVEIASMLEERVNATETVVAGVDDLVLPGLSGRKFAVAPDQMISNPMARWTERMAELSRLLEDATCEQAAILWKRWKLRVIVARGVPPDVGINVLVATGSRKVGSAVGRSSIAIDHERLASLECIESVDVLPGYVMYFFDPKKLGEG